MSGGTQTKIDHVSCRLNYELSLTNFSPEGDVVPKENLRGYVCISFVEKVSLLNDFYFSKLKDHTDLDVDGSSTINEDVFFFLFFLPKESFTFDGLIIVTFREFSKTN